MDLVSQFVHWLSSYLSFGHFLIIDLIAATTNALNSALLAQRPDYYKGRYWTTVGILLLAVLGGNGGGIARDLLLDQVPVALTNPWYLILCVLAGFAGLALAFDRGLRFREVPFQLMTAYALPWYAAIGVEAGRLAQLPAPGCVLLGVVGATAGRFLIDLSAGRAAELFVRSEWLVGTAVLTSVVYLALARAGLSIWPATLLAVVAGFAFRLAALWYGWEEPLPRLPADFLEGLPRRVSMREKLRPGRKPAE